MSGRTTGADVVVAWFQEAVPGWRMPPRSDGEYHALVARIDG